MQQVERDRDRERERKSSTVSDDIWANEKDQWLTSAQQQQQQPNSDAWSTTRDALSPPKSLNTAGGDNDYMSDVASNGGRMYRSVSGQSLGDLDQYQQQQQLILQQQQQQLQQQQNGNQRQVLELILSQDS